MKATRVAAAGAALALAFGAFTAPANANTYGEGEGCTPGFWKNNPGAWVEDTVNGKDILIPTSKKIGTIFDLDGYADLADKTMLEALQFKGGAGFEGKVRNLLRIATASWLNAAVEIQFPLKRVELVSKVNAAIASGDASKVTALQSKLDALNNADCPLSADEAAK